ncbi:unnamed protein product, partial [Prorocentrum cordatum]
CTRETAEEFHGLSAGRAIDAALRPHVSCQPTPLDTDAQAQEMVAVVPEPTTPITAGARGIHRAMQAPIMSDIEFARCSICLQTFQPRDALWYLHC